MVEGFCIAIEARVRTSLINLSIHEPLQGFHEKC